MKCLVKLFLKLFKNIGLTYKLCITNDMLTRNIEIGKQVLEEIGFIFDDMEKLLNNTKIY